MLLETNMIIKLATRRHYLPGYEPSFLAPPSGPSKYAPKADKVYTPVNVEHLTQKLSVTPNALYDTHLLPGSLPSRTKPDQTSLSASEFGRIRQLTGGTRAGDYTAAHKKKDLDIRKKKDSAEFASYFPKRNKGMKFGIKNPSPNFRAETNYGRHAPKEPSLSDNVKNTLNSGIKSMHGAGVSTAAASAGLGVAGAGLLGGAAIMAKRKAAARAAEHSAAKMGRYGKGALLGLAGLAGYKLLKD